MMSPSLPRPSAPDEVAILVLNWNGWRHTVACVESLGRLDYRNHRIVVIDNASHDGSPDRIAEVCPGVIVLQAGANLGFAGGNNVGIRYALEGGARFVWLLNNDTVVVPGALNAMMDEMGGRQDVGIVGSVIRSAAEPKAIEAWGGGTVNRYVATTRRLTAPNADRLDYVAGTSMLVRREVFEEIGLLDDVFFFFLEDADFCFRAAVQGWNVAVSEAAVVFHVGGATVNEGRRQRSERADRFHAESSGIFVGKHGGQWGLLMAVPRLCGMAVRRVLRGHYRRIPDTSRAFIRGLARGVRHRATLGGSPRPPLPRQRRLRTPST